MSNLFFCNRYAESYEIAHLEDRTNGSTRVHRSHGGLGIRSGYISYGYLGTDGLRVDWLLDAKIQEREVRAGGKGGEVCEETKESPVPKAAINDQEWRMM